MGRHQHNGHDVRSRSERYECGRSIISDERRRLCLSSASNHKSKLTFQYRIENVSLVMDPWECDHGGASILGTGIMSIIRGYRLSLSRPREWFLHEFHTIMPNILCAIIARSSRDLRDIHSPISRCASFT